jgi:hypothetical protein
MQIHVHFEREYEYDAYAWTIGHCDFCKQPGPVTVEKAFDTLKMFGVSEVSRVYRGDVHRCDFCKRLIGASTNPTLPLDGWSQMDGIPALAEKLGIVLPDSLGEINTPTRFHSLLSAASQCYSLWRFDNLAGVAVGAMIGFLGGVILGLILDILDVFPRKWNALAIGPVVGAAGGSLIGAYVWFIVERNKRAMRLFLRAYQQYGMDLDKLCFVAETHGRWIQKVAERARRQVLFR